MKNTEKPKIFLFLRIIAIVLAIVGVILLIKGLTSSSLEMTQAGWFEAQSGKMGTIFGGIASLMFGGVLTFVSFIPEISKTGIKTVKYIQRETKDDLTTIVDTGADIASGAITKTTRAIKKGFMNDSEEENATKFCKHCGEKIDADSKFCNECGNKQ